MKGAVKWVVWAGAAFVLASFFLPSVQQGESAPISLFEMARQAGGWRLFSVIAGAAIIVVLGVISEWRRVAEPWWRLGQALALALSELGVVSAFLPWATTPTLARFLLTPGAVLLGCGYLAIIAGILIGALRQIPRKPAPTAMAGTRLEVLQGKVVPPFPLNGSEFTVGRSRRNQLVLRESIVSGVHARFREAQGHWFIQDQDSFNGTFVNDKKVQAQRLKDGDRIRIGSTTLLFRCKP